MSLHRDGLSNLRESHPQPERARITEVQMYQGDQYDTVSKAHHAPLGPFGGRSAALRRRKRQPRLRRRRNARRVHGQIQSCEAWQL